MKACIKQSFVLTVLITALSSLWACRVPGQVFTTLYAFTGGRDGANPNGLVLSSNTLYGTAYEGGSAGSGTVFSLNTDGTGFTVFHGFTGPDVSPPPSGSNSDGSAPRDLILSGNILYGTTQWGGDSGHGTVFRVNADGLGSATLYSFTLRTGGGQPINSDGAWPWAGLVLSGNTLYGTATSGGSSGAGTVFSVNTDGAGFAVLYTFSGSEGADPGGLVLSGNTLYGTAAGGVSGSGTVFALNTDGTGFAALHSFSTQGYDPEYSAPYDPNYGGGPVFTNSDGVWPGGLVLSGDSLYGATYQGGFSGSGTVFKLNTDGTGFTTVYTFTVSSTNASGLHTNSDGINPAGGLLLSGNTLYGSTLRGGSFGGGTVFAVNTDGTGFAVLHNFEVSQWGKYTIGASPSHLILSGNTLYGTAVEGGVYAPSGFSPFPNGMVFSISLSPRLTITPAGRNIILTWPSEAAGFSYAGYALQSTTNLVSGVWILATPAPVIVNGQNTVTNPVSGAQQFYRLRQ